MTDDVVYLPEDPIPNIGPYEKRGSPLVANMSIRGPRGGVRTPVCIVWRTHGTGLFTLVNGAGEAALFPWVKWLNGGGHVQYTRCAEWRDFAEAASKREASK